MKDNLFGRIASGLVGGLFGICVVWMMFVPSTVTRGEMQDYVQVTAVEHLRLLREDLRDMREAVVDMGQRLAGVETILRER